MYVEAAVTKALGRHMFTVREYIEALGRYTFTIGSSAEASMTSKAATTSVTAHHGLWYLGDLLAVDDDSSAVELG